LKFSNQGHYGLSVFLSVQDIIVPMNSGNRYTVQPGLKSDLPAVLTLLERRGLPQEGLSEHWQTMLVARADGKIVGSAALEIYGRYALLRSVAVAETSQGYGLGSQLTNEALELARTLGVGQVYLLTETASDFFPRFGFYLVDRDAVPTSVKGSIEFTSACPDSALAMTLNLEEMPGLIRV